MHEKQKLFLTKDADIDFEKVSGVKYILNSEFEQISKDFLKEFILHNPLHFEIFRGSRQMEAEIISMIGSILESPKVLKIIIYFLKSSSPQREVLLELLLQEVPKAI